MDDLYRKYEALWDQQDILFNEFSSNKTYNKDQIDKIKKHMYDVESAIYNVDNKLNDIIKYIHQVQNKRNNRKIYIRIIIVIIVLYYIIC